MKRCARCKLEKDESGFNKCKQKKDGLSVYCRICKSLEAKKYNIENREKCAENLRKWREKNPEKSKEYSKKDREINKEKIIARRSRPEAREKINVLIKKWQEANPERVRENNRRWKRANRDTENARSLVAKAIRRGKIMRPNRCEKCKKECTPDGHHLDYSKPLEVQWLCKICHMKGHGKLKDLIPNG
jgi:hypothetical protein